MQFNFNNAVLTAEINEQMEEMKANPNLIKSELIIFANADVVIEIAITSRAEYDESEGGITKGCAELLAEQQYITVTP